MALKITKSSDPIRVSQLALCIYGAPGLGKTSTAFTADKTLLLDFDNGAHRSGNRGDTVQISAWSDVENITADDLAAYNTVAIDTAGRALDCLTAHLIADNPKFKGYGGALTLQGYGALKSSFTGWTKLLKSFGKDVVLLAHSDEQRNGDDVMERLDVQGGSKNEIYKAVDAMARLSVVDKRRILNFDPTAAAFGKNPAGFEPLVVPDFTGGSRFLADVIAAIKDKLNAESAEMVSERDRVEKLIDDLESLNDIDEYNNVVQEMANADPKDKALLVKIAGKKGFRFDRKTKSFVEATA